MGYSLRTQDHRYIEWRYFDTKEIRAAELYEYEDELWETRNSSDDPHQQQTREALKHKLAEVIK